jgi:hypothetical protein
MANPPENQEKVKASFLFWLVICTNPTFESYDDTAAHPVTPSGWDADNLPANMQALDPSGQGIVTTILDYLANNNAADGKPYWFHFQAVQAAYQAVMNGVGANHARTVADTPPTYTAGDPTCPKIENLTGLVLSYSSRSPSARTPVKTARQGAKK